MYKNIKTIDCKTIESLNLSAKEKYDWVDTVLRNKKNYILPVKTRIPLKESDYFNVMPCVLPSEGVLGLKVVTRNENRRINGEPNIEGDILLYNYDDFLPKAIIDGALITTMRTAAVAVHSLLNLAPRHDIISMVGLGKIGTEIGNILFDLVKDEHITVKLYRYKNQAEKFIDTFKRHSNIEFVICDTYEETMRESDVIISSITFIQDDFCSPEVYKKNCTIIPVHLRGFKNCDKTFDNIITSDLISIKKFENYSLMKKITYIDDIFSNRENYHPANQTLVYNLGLAVYDIFFAEKIFNKILSID